MRFHPLRRAEARIVATMAVSEMASLDGLTDDQQHAISDLQNNENGSFHLLVMSLVDASDTAEPEAQGLRMALAAPVPPPGPGPRPQHPILDWLFNKGGLAWIWSWVSPILMSLLSAWLHIPLPPLPIPPLPQPAMAMVAMA